MVLIMSERDVATVGRLFDVEMVPWRAVCCDDVGTHTQCLSIYLCLKGQARTEERLSSFTPATVTYCQLKQREVLQALACLCSPGCQPRQQL